MGGGYLHRSYWTVTASARGSSFTSVVAPSRSTVDQGSRQCWAARRGSPTTVVADLARQASARLSGLAGLARLAGSSVGSTGCAALTARAAGAGLTAGTGCATGTALAAGTTLTASTTLAAGSALAAGSGFAASSADTGRARRPVSAVTAVTARGGAISAGPAVVAGDRDRIDDGTKESRAADGVDDDGADDAGVGGGRSGQRGYRCSQKYAGNRTQAGHLTMARVGVARPAIPLGTVLTSNRSALLLIHLTCLNSG